MKLGKLPLLFLLMALIANAGAMAKAVANQLVWSYKTDGDILSVSIDNAYVVAGSSDHKVYLFNKDGKLLWSYDTGDQVWSVAISNGHIVASSNCNIYLFNKDGKLLWSYKTDGWVRSVSMKGDYIVAGSADHKVYLFNTVSYTHLTLPTKA